MTPHIALLGDSIFDNSSYIHGEPDVVSHLRDLLPSPWRATLCAIDGSVAADLARQLTGVPTDCSHLVISVGGNDALHSSPVLNMPVRSTGEALSLLGDPVVQFEKAYRSAIDGALKLKRDTTVCTIYNGNFGHNEAVVLRLAVALFNDVILRVAFERGLRVIDLRFVCCEPSDYANAIEPSGSGGRKIAQAIARSVGAIVMANQPAQVFVG